MTRALGRSDAAFVMLAVTCLVAWWALAFAPGSEALPAICSGGLLAGPPSSAALDLLVFNSPAELAGRWALMVAAMMLPLTVVPLQHVRNRSFARRRARAMFLFVAGYIALWMAAGAGLQASVVAMRWAVATPLLCLGLAVAIAIAWQVSPAKQWFLNNCHRLPQLAAFGPAADRDAFRFGLTNAASCVGACWALMLLTMFVGQGHFAWMLVVTLFVFAERLEGAARPAWRWRGAGKALRIVKAQATMRWQRTTEAGRIGDEARNTSLSGR
jgi:predicted metal-binding membrane protein